MPVVNHQLVSVGEIIFGWELSELVSFSTIRRKLVWWKVQAEKCWQTWQTLHRWFRLSIECSTQATHQQFNLTLLCSTKVFFMLGFVSQNPVMDQQCRRWRRRSFEGNIVMILFTVTWIIFQQRRWAFVKTSSMSRLLFGWRKLTIKMFIRQIISLSSRSVILVTFTFLVIAGTVFMCSFNNKRNFQNCLPTSKSDEMKMKVKLKNTAMVKFWECFALTTNYRFIISTKLNKKSIAPIHGIRALGALWIFAGHVYYYAFGPTDNLQLIFAYADSWLLQPLFSAAISVDSFYVMRFKRLSFASNSSSFVCLFAVDSCCRTCFMRNKRKTHRGSSALTW